VPDQIAIDLGSLLARCVEITPDRPALTFEGRTTTFGRLGTRVRRLAEGLRAGGVGRGDRIAYVGVNHPSFLETLFAAASIGAVFVPLNSRLTGPELEYILTDAEAHTIISDAERLPLIDSIRDSCKPRRCVALTDQPPDHGWESYEEVLAGAAELSALAAPAGDETALVMYTSGTTGRPKGAMLSHQNLFLHHVNALHALDVSADDVTLVVAPLFHIGGLNVLTLTTMLKTGHAVLFSGFDAPQALRAIEHHHVTTMFGVPAMFNFMAQDPAFGATDLSSVRFFVCGGAPVPEVLIRTYAEREVPFVQAYGLTETAPLALVLGQDQVARRPGSAGHKQMMLSEVRLKDRDGNLVPVGEPGEVCIRGPQVMSGYWRDPGATAAVFDADGFFHSGDVGYEDPDGFVYLVDRSKDMVISGGENVYPAEVEAVLYDHPAVAEVAVIGTPHDRWGEAVTAIVVLRPGHDLALDELRAFARHRLAGFKLPVRLELVANLPRTSSGKVMKFRLKEQFR